MELLVNSLMCGGSGGMQLSVFLLGWYCVLGDFCPYFLGDVLMEEIV